MSPCRCGSLLLYLLLPEPRPAGGEGIGRRGGLRHQSAEGFQAWLGPRTHLAPAPLSPHVLAPALQSSQRSRGLPPPSHPMHSPPPCRAPREAGGEAGGAATPLSPHALAPTLQSSQRSRGSCRRGPGCRSAGRTPSLLVGGCCAASWGLHTEGWGGAAQGLLGVGSRGGAAGVPKVSGRRLDPIPAVVCTHRSSGGFRGVQQVTSARVEHGTGGGCGGPPVVCLAAALFNRLCARRSPGARPSASPRGTVAAPTQRCSTSPPNLPAPCFTRGGVITPRGSGDCPYARLKDNRKTALPRASLTAGACSRLASMRRQPQEEGGAPTTRGGAARDAAAARGRAADAVMAAAGHQGCRGVQSRGFTLLGSGACPWKSDAG